MSKELLIGLLIYFEVLYLQNLFGKVSHTKKPKITKNLLLFIKFLCNSASFLIYGSSEVANISKSAS